MRNINSVTDVFLGTAFSKNTAGRTLLISCDCSLKTSRIPFYSLMPGGNKGS